ncbi:hypothetical protein ACWDYH_20950 [Nocardia goodfellowii]
MSTPEPPGGWEPTQYPPGPQPRGPQPPGDWQPYPPPGWQGPPPKSNDGLVQVLMALTGAFGYLLVNSVVAFFLFITALEHSTNTVPIALGAVGGVLLAFGGGTALILLRKPWSKGLGLGLMIGWALMTVCTVGFCTGVNPTIYTA